MMKKVRLSDFQNPGSTSYSSGRFPKVSIGVTVDEYAKLGAGGNEENCATSGKAYSFHDNISRQQNPEIAEETILKENRPTEQKSGGWLSPRAARRASVFREKTSELPGEQGKNGAIQQISLTTMRKIETIDGEKIVGESHKLADQNTEALRVKLWESLGTFPSQRNQESPTFDDLPQDSRKTLEKEHLITESAMPKQNSDTIEPDTESPLQTTRRSLTHQSSRKILYNRAVLKPQQTSVGKGRLSSRSGSKEGKPEVDIFVFQSDMGPVKSLKSSFKAQSSNSIRRRRRNKGSFESGEAIVPARAKNVSAKKKEQTLASAETPSIRSKDQKPSRQPSKGKNLLQTTKDKDNSDSQLEDVKRVTDERSSLPPSEEHDGQNTESHHFRVKSFIAGIRKNNDEAFCSRCPRKIYLLPLHDKRELHDLDDVNIRNINLPSATCTVNGEDDILTEAVNQNPLDSFSRAAVELAKLLQSIKAKISSYRSKKNSEVLESVKEKFRCRLQDLESKIQPGVEKLHNASKSKRKHLDTLIEEQEERLNVIHNKFKQDLHHHLVDFNTIVEELEARHLELKRSLEKQKSSHKKLLLKVKEEMKVQLSDAEISIAAIRWETKKKMKSIKLVFEEWMSEN